MSPIGIALESSLFDMFMLLTEGVTRLRCDQLFDKFDTKLDSRMRTGVNKPMQIPQMFHVKHFLGSQTLLRLFHVNHSFSDAELRENHIQYFFNVDIAGNASEILRCAAHVFSAQFQRQIISLCRY